IHQTHPLGEIDIFFVLTLSRLTPLRSGQGVASATAHSRVLIVYQRSIRAFMLSARKTTASQPILCALLTWWLLRSGCTRSHSELGRETLQRRWYFVLRHG